MFRPIFLQASCASMNQIAQNITGSSLLLNLEPLLSPTGVCATEPTGGGLGTLPSLPLSSRRAPSTRATMEKREAPH